jgi:CRP-like cAMP-binding protein
MSIDTVAGRVGEDCLDCELRQRGCFQPIGQDELAVIAALKRGEVQRDAGAVLIAEGAAEAPLYTLLSGWAFRFKTLPDGRRQILSFLLPGDFIGLQQKMTEVAAHGVEALTAVRLCSFQRDAVWKLHASLPQLGYDLTWLAAHEESLVDYNLLSVGRHNALERIASLVLWLHDRSAAVDPQPPGVGMRFPLTQQHLADALGLSLAHTNKTWQRLVRSGLLRWQDGPRLRLPDPAALAALAQLGYPVPQRQRPLI